jgi:proteasome accessory factor C
MTVDAGERLQRVLRAMPAIVSRNEIAIDDMPALAGVDALTLLDDLRALTEREDEPGGFVEAVSILFSGESVSVTSPHFHRPTRITLPELCALELGLAIVGATSTPGERPAVERARERVRNAIVAMPESAARADLWYATGPAVRHEPILDTLQQCVVEKAKANLVYRRGDSTESTHRVVHPYAVVPVRGAWFLVAHCERTNGLRFFRVDRVQSAVRLDEKFELPSSFPSEVSELLSGAGRALSSSPAERLVVRYSPRIARWIAEREEGEQGSDGSFTVSHPLADDAWAVRHMLQYGPEAVVLEPARIRARVTGTLRAISASVA